jgi:hypothetical protein
MDVSKRELKSCIVRERIKKKVDEAEKVPRMKSRRKS